ncbi:3-oxoadipyl-CoA thiolase [Sphingobium fluviale]|uniref:Beta-ketoadipyl-CoA thiolase n=1 Tax=Sphingobium fluviale TaxID=2506423 RepID=A0A4Q1KM24_9SPHN|nr:3-oxoadipyl-CoA thiolase [Sphingobium fluviale]RXR30480.1 3-oxoadipyl-CoA thiolase [Sphingobium fluviale]
MNRAFICDAVRTPIGRYGGALAAVRPDDLAAHAIRALLDRNPAVPGEAIDEVILGCANQAGEDNRNVARMAALLAGLPVGVSGSTINRLCASGADAVGSAARAIVCGEADLVVAGGVESMTRAPLVMPKADKPWARVTQVEDTTIGWRFVNPLMRAAHGTDSMPETAENVAREYGVSRADQDAFAMRSQNRAARAQADGYFAEELVPIVVRAGRKDVLVDTDQHPRPDTSLETLASLTPIVCSDGTVTAGNSSGVNDGAAALLIASEGAIERYGLNPQARIVGMACAGVPPRTMGIGPVAATRKLLGRLGMVMGDFDLIEINEAFASQVIASLRSLDVDPMEERVNPNGGAIALGHPLGMSGARLAMTASHMLVKTGASTALVSMCVGVGQGLSLILERA